MAVSARIVVLAGLTLLFAGRADAQQDGVAAALRRHAVRPLLQRSRPCACRSFSSDRAGPSAGRHPAPGADQSVQPAVRRRLLAVGRHAQQSPAAAPERTGGGQQFIHASRRGRCARRQRPALRGRHVVRSDRQFLAGAAGRRRGTTGCRRCRAGRGARGAPPHPARDRNPAEMLVAQRRPLALLPLKRIPALRKCCRHCGGANQPAALGHGALHQRLGASPSACNDEDLHITVVDVRSEDLRK